MFTLPVLSPSLSPALKALYSSSEGEEEESMMEVDSNGHAEEASKVDPAYVKLENDLVRMITR